MPCRNELQAVLPFQRQRDGNGAYGQLMNHHDEEGERSDDRADGLEELSAAVAGLHGMFPPNSCLDVAVAATKTSCPRHAKAQMRHDGADFVLVVEVVD
jgi:hypothetical protein